VARFFKKPTPTTYSWCGFQPDRHASNQEVQGDPVIGMCLTLASARKLANEILRQRTLGVDVASVRRANKIHNHADTFGAAVHDFVNDYAKPRTRQWTRTAKLLGLSDDGSTVPDGLVDRWGARPVKSISADDIHALVEECRLRGVPGWKSRTAGKPSPSRARHMFSALGSMFGWLHRSRRLDQNPTLGLHNPEGGKSRDRILSDAEIKLFWDACSQIGAPHSAILRLLLLTGSRLREISELRRSEINGATLTLPGSRTKNHRPHTIPLSDTAMAILAAVPDRGHDLVFSKVGGWYRAKLKMERLMGPNVEPWVYTIYAGHVSRDNQRENRASIRMRMEPGIV
jgi:Phage integrase family